MADDTFQTNSDDTTNPMADMKDNQQLPEDNDTPFSPPDGVQDRIDDTHQMADTGVDEHQRYDEGIEGATEANLPGQAADEDPQAGEAL